MRDEEKKEEMSGTFDRQMDESVDGRNAESTPYKIPAADKIEETSVAECSEEQEENQESVRDGESDDIEKDSNSKKDDKKSMPQEKNEKEKAYDWLYEHHVTVRVIDTVLVLCAIAMVVIIILGRR
ncbi:MAG: hypothetical protein SO016_00860 [Lachnospiraceae bacterium]|nr:hypothetical protein [Robinsoniella sp.]MDY3765237.1 hypothetical protein [Lachnospiraceae bacterium]